jgi:two-component system, OmpR family, heavy metal sensor histidine kinase CusS
MFLIRETIDPRRWALSWRLSAYFAGATSIIVFGVMWVMYGQLTGQLHEKDEIELGDTLKVQLGILKELDSGKEPVLWQREWTENALRNEKVLLRVLAPNGGVYGASPGFATPMESFPLASSEGSFKRVEGNHGKTSSTSYLLTARSLEVLPDRVWTVQAVLDTSSSDRILEKYRERLILMMCAAILVSCGMGWVLVRRGLAPLRKMNSAIAGIDSRRLHARIADQAWPSDLRELAQSFDDMLRRLEIAFEQLSRFSSNLAHEFRSPITNLVAAASVMLSRERTAAEYQETLAVVVEEGERLSRMVSSMLFLARAENAKQALQP